MNKIEISGDIASWNESARYLAYKLKGLSGDLEVEIGSFGGDVFEGIEMFNILRKYSAEKGQVTTVNVGKVMSIASLIYLAGDKKKSYKNATIMIHKAWTWLAGNADDLEKEAKILSGIDAVLANEYSKYMKESKDEISNIMSEEGWFIGEEQLKDSGMVDEFIDIDSKYDTGSQASYRKAMSAFSERARAISDKPDFDKVAKAIMDCSGGECPVSCEGEVDLGGVVEDTVVPSDNVKSAKNSTQGSIMTEQEISAMQDENKVLLANRTTLLARNETLAFDLDTATAKILTLTADSEAKLSEATAKIEADFKVKADENAKATMEATTARVNEAFKTGVASAETIIAMISADSEDSASKIALNAKETTVAIKQGEETPKGEESKMLAYAKQNKGRIK